MTKKIKKHTKNQLTKANESQIEKYFYIDLPATVSI